MQVGDARIGFSDSMAAMAAAERLRTMMLGGAELGAVASVYAYEEGGASTTAVWLFDLVVSWSEVEDEDEFEEILENVRSLLTGACQHALENLQEFDEEAVTTDSSRAEFVRKLRSRFDEFLRDEDDAVEVSIPDRPSVMGQKEEEADEVEVEDGEGQEDATVNNSPKIPVPAVRMKFRTAAAAEAAKAVLHGVIIGGQSVAAVLGPGSSTSPPPRPISITSSSPSLSHTDLPVSQPRRIDFRPVTYPDDIEDEDEALEVNIHDSEESNADFSSASGKLADGSWWPSCRAPCKAVRC